MHQSFSNPYELSHFVNVVIVVSISRLISLPCSNPLSELLLATLLRLLARNNSLKALSEGQYDQSDKVLDHLDDPSCWCPKLVFGVVDCASIAHEARRSR